MKNLLILFVISIVTVCYGEEDFEFDFRDEGKRNLTMDSPIPRQESCQCMTGPLTDFVHKIAKS